MQERERGEENYEEKGIKAAKEKKKRRKKKLIEGDYAQFASWIFTFDAFRRALILFH